MKLSLGWTIFGLSLVFGMNPSIQESFMLSENVQTAIESRNMPTIITAIINSTNPTDCYLQTLETFLSNKCIPFDPDWWEYRYSIHQDYRSFTRTLKRVLYLLDTKGFIRYGSCIFFEANQFSEGTQALIIKEALEDERPLVASLFIPTIDHCLPDAHLNLFTRACIEGKADLVVRAFKGKQTRFFWDVLDIRPTNKYVDLDEAHQALLIYADRVDEDDIQFMGQRNLLTESIVLGSLKKGDYKTITFILQNRRIFRCRMDLHSSLRSLKINFALAAGLGHLRAIKALLAYAKINFLADFQSSFKNAADYTTRSGDPNLFKFLYDHQMGLEMKRKGKFANRMMRTRLLHVYQQIEKILANKDPGAVQALYKILGDTRISIELLFSIVGKQKFEYIGRYANALKVYIALHLMDEYLPQELTELITTQAFLRPI